MEDKPSMECLGVLQRVERNFELYPPLVCRGKNGFCLCVTLDGGV